MNTVAAIRALREPDRGAFPLPRREIDPTLGRRHHSFVMDVAALRSHIEKQMPAALEMLRQMVGINSYTRNKAGVTELAHLTARQFASLGFEAEFVPAANPDYSEHLVLTRRGTKPRTLAMVSHLDTVFPPEEEERNNFRWQPEGDRIFGPGTQDIKGGTVMMWLVLSALRTCATPIFEALTWRLFLNSAEECFSPDFGDVCRARLGKDPVAALVFEAEGRLGDEHLAVVARKGRAAWRVTVRGRAAHAGGAHARGANAAVEIGLVVQRIAGLTNYSKDLTFNVGAIHSGGILNRVPHEAVAEGEFRCFTPELFQEAKNALLALNGPGAVRSPVDGHRCQVQVEVVSESRPWPRNPGSDRLLEVWVQAGQSLGLPVAGQERGGLSDGNLIWDALPTLDGLGPWGDNDHCSERTADGSKLPEFVDVTTFVPKALLNTMAICRLVRSSGT